MKRVDIWTWILNFGYAAAIQFVVVLFYEWKGFNSSQNTNRKLLFVGDLSSFSSKHKEKLKY